MQSRITIPLFPLGLVLLPQMPLHLHIFEERYKIMIGECLEKNKEFGIVYFNGTDIQAIGCTASIQRVLKRYDDGRLDILTRGENRFEINEVVDHKPYLEAGVTFFDDKLEKNTDACQELADNGMNLLKQFAGISGVQGEYGFAEIMDFKSISFLIAGCEGFIPLSANFLQAAEFFSNLSSKKVTSASRYGLWSCISLISKRVSPRIRISKRPSS